MDADAQSKLPEFSAWRKWDAGMSRGRRSPSGEDWLARAEALGLKRQGNELVGPCPSCRDGEDRFHVHFRGHRTGQFHCRVCHARGDATSASRILDAAGFERVGARGGIDIPGAPRRPAASRPPSAPSQPPPDLPPDLSRRSGDDTAKRIRTALSLWRAAGDDPGCIAAYLSGRGVWPSHWKLPAAVRWLPRERLPFPLNGWPEDAVGCVVYGFAVGKTLCAVQLECLAADGARLLWMPHTPKEKPFKRKTFGSARGAAFRIPGTGDAVCVSEGPIDALAIAAHTGMTAWATAGAGSLPSLAEPLAALACPVTIEAQGDQAGRRHSDTLWVALAEAGAHVRVREWPDGKDPAECYEADLLERAGVLEEAGMDAASALAQAWKDAAPVPGGGADAACTSDTTGKGSRS